MRSYLPVLVLVSSLSFFTGCSCGDPEGPGDDTPGNSVDGGNNPQTPSNSDGGSDGGTDAGVLVILPVDPNDPQNDTKDNDCDGLSNAEELAATYAAGRKTDPENPDSDNDGIPDGVELGRTSSEDTACAAFFVADADPTTVTQPTQADSDVDGVLDGREDRNHNGKLDSGELDPRNPDSDGDQLQDGVEDANGNGLVDTGETNPLLADTDGDAINDGVEVHTTHTNPLKADTDGDGCIDSAEDTNQNGVKDTGDTNPNDGSDCGNGLADADQDGLPDTLEAATGTLPNQADTDGDGLPDGLEDKNHDGKVNPGETNPRNKDTDCDGLIDGPDQGAVLGEDQNADGLRQSVESDPLLADTDADGLKDGIERGVTQNPEPTQCGGFIPAGQPATGTSPTHSDSDGDGIPDGAEDLNQNGKLDPGELNPTQMSDGSGPAAEVCTLDKLRAVTFFKVPDADLHLALPPSFTVLNTATVGGKQRGVMGYDATSEVAFLAFRVPAPGGATQATQDETSFRATVAAQGALGTTTTTQTFTTWEGFPAVQAFYDQTSAQGLRTQANALANALVGAGAGVLSSGGPSGPFKLQAEYIHRSNQSVVLVIALTPASNFVEPALFRMSDTAGGSAVAQFLDRTGVQCETFVPGSAKVDFLFAVDDSGSMASSQTSLAAAATAMANRLNNSELDWRIAMVTSAYHLNGTNTNGTSNNMGIRRGFTRDIHQFRAWLTQNSTCGSGVCSGLSPAMPACDSNDAESDGINNGCWVAISGNGSEGLLGAARKATNDLFPGVGTGPGSEVRNKVRTDAKLVIILLGDADDQTSGYQTTSGSCGGSGCESVSNFTGFFLGNGAAGQTTRNPLSAPITVHGIVCPDGAATSSSECGSEYRASPHRQGAVIAATGGVRGSIIDSASITNAINTIVDSAIASAGHHVAKPPIGASIKVAMNAVTDAACPKNDLPRSRVDGFDFNGQSNTLSFYGKCRPSGATTAAAVSYRYWIDQSPNPNGAPPPCSTDTGYFDPNEADFCKGRLACNLQTDVCECPPGCGANAPQGQVCDANKNVCDFVCTADCGGSCNGYQSCVKNGASCGCVCVQDATCAPGFTFVSSTNFCGCACDTNALGCSGNFVASDVACACVCPTDCGGCPTGQSCNVNTCQCTGSIE